MFAFCWVSLLAWKIGNPWSEVRRKIRFRDRELIGSLNVVIDELEKSNVIWIWVVSYIHSFQASTDFGLSTFTIAFQASTDFGLITFTIAFWLKANLTWKQCRISFSSRLNHVCQDVCVSIRADMRFTKPTSSIHWMHDCKQANCRVVICGWNASTSRKLKQSDWWRHARPTSKEELLQDSLSCWSFFESCPCLQLEPSWARLSQSSTYRTCWQSCHISCLLDSSGCECRCVPLSPTRTRKGSHQSHLTPDGLPHPITGGVGRCI